MSIHYRIIKCELDEEGSLLSLGPIPGKLLSIQQANLRVSTLNDDFHYIIETVYTEDRFYKDRHFFQFKFYQPIHGVTVLTNMSYGRTEVSIKGEALDVFPTYAEAKVALTTLGISHEGLD